MHVFFDILLLINGHRMKNEYKFSLQHFFDMAIGREDYETASELAEQEATNKARSERLLRSVSNQAFLAPRDMDREDKRFPDS